MADSIAAGIRYACEDVDFAVDPVPDFHARLSAVRETGCRVVPVRYLNQTAWVILRHDDVMAAYCDEEGLPAAAAYLRHSAPAQGRTLLCMTGEEHRINRLLVSGAFRPSSVRRYLESLLVPLANEMIDALDGAGGPRTADLVDRYTRRYPFRVITRLLGIPVTDEPQLLRWLEGLFAFPWDPQTALTARKAIGDYLRPIVDTRRAAPRDDLISLLVTAEVEGHRLSEEEIFSFIRLIFPAGSDTTYLAMGSLLWAVLRDRELYRTLCQRPEARPDAVEEGLRLYSAICLQPRYTEREVTIAGVTIPANSILLFGNATANRDPAVFEAPDEFRLQRPQRDSLTFGAGPHFCLGSHLARAELQVSLGLLLDRLQGLRLATNDVSGPTGAVLRGVRHLPVVFDAIVPAPQRTH
ncbi:MAG: cytochrome P450 [Candidatus Binatia bacterium]